MKKFLVFLSAMFICVVAVAQTINVTWKVDNTTYATNTCEYGGTLTVPSTPPTKYGYTFQGWASYTFLEYIESTGTQYIDTGCYAQTGSIIEVDFQANDYDGWHTVYGNLNGKGNWFAYSLNTSTEKNSYIYGTYFDIDYPININRHIVRQESEKFYLDGNLVYTCPSKIFYNDSSVYVFARGRNPDNYPEYRFHGKIFSVKIWSNGTDLSFYGIPARNHDGAIGMYDTVSGTFFTNAGTGEFIAGPAK